MAIWHWLSSVIETAIFMFDLFVNDKLFQGSIFGRAIVEYPKGFWIQKTIQQEENTD